MTTPIRRALLSVSDKTGLAEFARALAGRGVELVSSGGTAKALAEEGLAVVEVADVTRFPEMLDGRVKTLHPAIHGGILARRDRPEHMAALEAHGIGPIDLVVVTLYPFEEAVAGGKSFADCLEKIDIGGPALIRAAAKNHQDVAVVVHPGDYAPLLAEMEERQGCTSLAFRRGLAARAFARTGAYDAAIAAWFAREGEEPFTRHYATGGGLIQGLRYGENPHQQGAFFSSPEIRPGVARARVVQGKELSYNNIMDADHAFELASAIDGPAVAIIKHGNPCGAAEANDLVSAHGRALACDPVSAFGGVVAVNRVLDEAAAKAIAAIFTEVVIAPDAQPSALAALAEKKNLRVLLTGGLAPLRPTGRTVRSVAGGLLVQDRDIELTDPAGFKVVTSRAPSEAEMVDLGFAWAVCRSVASNAIVFARGRATVGIGAGQMSRVDSVRIAAWKAEEAARNAGLPEPKLKGSVVASDAFFPFADGLIAAAVAGATAVIQPGGSVRDNEVIAAANDHGIAMIFTGRRHFRH